MNKIIAGKRGWGEADATAVYHYNKVHRTTT